MATKVCTKCKQCLPLSEFTRRKWKTGVGYRAECRACNTDRKRKYNQQNKGKLNELRRKHYEENKGKLTELRRKQRKANSVKEKEEEKVVEHMRKWSRANPVEATAYTRKWHDIGLT